MIRAFLILLSLQCCATTIQDGRTVGQPGAPPPAEALRLLTTSWIPNAVRVHEKVISGGAPQGEAGFRELLSLGIKTIISVDGAKPDVDTAYRMGIRTIHLPHGYDGISRQRSLELAKAVLSSEGPVYIHCHHGQHRSPAAAAVACVVAGLIPPEDAPRVLKLARTSKNYKGLFDVAGSARPVPNRVLEQLHVEFKEAEEVAPLANAMVAIEVTHDHLGKIAASDWKSPEAHPDLDPTHETLLLREHFAELLRFESSKGREEAFLSYLRESLSSARDLESLLQQDSDQPARSPQTLAAADRIFRNISKRCTECHGRYRDFPQSADR